MKTLLFAFMLLASLQSNGQKLKSDTTSWGSIYWSVPNEASGHKLLNVNWSTSASMFISSDELCRYKSDTLYIKQIGRAHV